MIKPPFRKKQKVISIRRSPDRELNGTIIGMCWCPKRTVYTIDGSVYHHKFGWFVEITGELHRASDFKAL